jgi:TatD DNase family protein
VEAEPGFIDTHCHLCLDDFETDLEEVLQRAREANVQRVLVPGVDMETSERAVELSQGHPMLFAAVGIHPHSAQLWSPSMADRLKDLVEEDGVVAVGEIGLDYKRELSDREQQVNALMDQLEIARHAELPVVLHNRQSVEDLLEILSARTSGLPKSLIGRAGVLHAFGGSISEGIRAGRMGLYLGIAGPITFHNAVDARSLVSALPMDRIIIETDSPYLSPHPYRGKRNEPARVRLVAEKLAELFEQDTSGIAEQTTYNASYLFGWNNGIDHRDVL